MGVVDQALVPLRRPASSNNNNNINHSSTPGTSIRAFQQGGACARPATAAPPRVAACRHGENRLLHATGGRGSGRRRSRSAPSMPQLPPSLCSSVYGKASKATGTTVRRRPASSGRLPQQQQQQQQQQQHGKDAKNTLRSVRAMLPWWQYPAAADTRPGNGDDDFVEAAATADTARRKKINSATRGNSNTSPMVSLSSGYVLIAGRDQMRQFTGKVGGGFTSTQQRSRSVPSPGASAPTSHTAHDDDDDDSGLLNGGAAWATRGTRGFNPQTHSTESASLNYGQLNETRSVESATRNDRQLNEEASWGTNNSGVNAPVNPTESAYDAYTDCSNLFENPPPSIPDVDQYIRRESVMYGAITQRARSKALPVKEPNGVLRVKKGVNVQRGAFEDERLEADIDPLALLFGDEDIDKVLAFFDSMGQSDGKVTIEEMTLGFRKIRREWANLKTDEEGRAVVGKLLRLLRRAGMSIEAWFKFTDSSQGGRGDGKLTPLELRVGFQRLATHIARRECCCHAYKCERIPNYGLPPIDDAKKDVHGEEQDDAQQGTAIVSRQTDALEFLPAVEKAGVVDKAAVVEKAGDGGVTAAAAAAGGGVGKGGDDPNGRRHVRGSDGNLGERAKKLPPVNADFAGKAIACREHALEGMVYLGQRRYFSGPDERTLSLEDINSLMRFVDTDVNYSLDIAELRLAITRAQSPPPSCSGTREAGDLLKILEQHMRTTGARFTDVFFSIDRDGNGVIERHELRAFFRRLAREPALERAKAKAKAELADERARAKGLLVLEAQEAFVRLEAYKKAGVYAVLKRIEVWQSRGGQRLGDIFQGVRTGDKGGECGMDADELAAFMRSLDLDLNPAEAMLVLRHLDVERNDLVELREIAAAVRNVRIDEAIIRDAKKRACPTLRPTSGGRRRLAGVSDRDASSALRRGAGRNRSGAGGAESTERPGTDGPAVFRPAVATITHGRAASAPALRERGGAITDATTTTTTTAGASNNTVLLTGGDNNTKPLHRGTTTTTTRPATSAAPGRPSTGLVRESAGSASSAAAAAAGERLGALKLRPGRTPGAASGDCASGARPPSVWRASRSRSGSRSPEVNPTERGLNREAIAAAAAAAAVSTAGDAPPTSSGEGAWARGFGDGLEGEEGWWPEALNAVEEGSRLDIYTGTILDGGWLESLDSRLSATVRATRR